MDSPDLSAAHLSQFLLTTYEGGSFVERLMLRYRPYICPFDEVLRRIPPGARVLDMGCGIGYLCALTAANCAPARVLGIDVNADAIREAQQSVYSKNGSVEFRTMPPNALPDEQFDLILCVDVLHHVPRPEQEAWLGRLTERLTPGGVLILKDISTRPVWKRCMNQLHDLVMAHQWVNPRNEEQAKDWLSHSNGSLLECIRINRLWYPHYLIRWQKA